MAYFSDEPAIAEYIKDFRFFYKGEWRSMLKRPDSRPEGMTAYEMRFDDPSNPPADDRTPPADNGWHFAHLGRDYFERKVQACAQHGISDIAAIWLGISGVAPYALSKHPRPNWAVEDSLGK